MADLGEGGGGGGARVPFFSIVHVNFVSSPVFCTVHSFVTVLPFSKTLDPPWIHPGEWVPYCNRYTLGRQSLRSLVREGAGVVAANFLLGFGAVGIEQDPMTNSNLHPHPEPQLIDNIPVFLFSVLVTDNYAYQKISEGKDAMTARVCHWKHPLHSNENRTANDKVYSVSRQLHANHQ